MFTGNVQLLKARASTFTGREGKEINMYYLSFLTENGDVVELTGTKEVYESATEMEKNANVEITFSLYESENGGKKALKGRVAEIKNV